MDGIAAELEAANAIVADFYGGEPSGPIAEGKVLAAALQSILQGVDSEKLDALIEENCSSFADYSMELEQKLEWTLLHQRYTTLVEDCISERLSELGCQAEELMRYAEQWGDDGQAAELVTKLLAMGNYNRFCALMARAASDTQTAGQ
mmetsp:Transcript_26308/g.43670  ORF Transcript_26308/g.43670 Transcript_26308/m.43670 type:complete len:148 (+) Transcript_26308:155-598(+)|eukprot:CAMPEP_0119313626 /NCGR_PEP_ID=MMETSP1333-20130426/29747_1 /TAXON_ID=418940 /ORGANISM="Scyphosphaera apsteinii, Strain RCC1455" /LENGTH=147 /DNA_ID=CAMNT_0007318491 /DNA_START=151 /DNA_END=594 /DNA_ORIENTATION=+